MEFTRDQIYVAHAVKWEADKVTIEIQFRRDYACQLSERPEENQFFTVLFVRMEDGRLVVHNPFAVERLVAPGGDKTDV